MESYRNPLPHPESSSDDYNYANNQNVRLYSPYQDLQIPHQIGYYLPNEPELLFPDQALQKGRSWGEKLTQFTGCGYLAGTLTGAGKGLVDGVRASEHGDTMKLKINRVLNASGQSGRSFGCRAGVIGLFYSGMESAISGYRGVDDSFNSVAAGLAAGVLYRSPAGIRSAAVAGVVGGLVAGLAVAAKQVAERYSPIDRPKFF